MKFSRPDVACNASRLLPRDTGITKSKWIEIIDEDNGKADRNFQKSVGLHDFSRLSHGTWHHFSYGDPVGNFKIDRGIYGDAEARRRHLARAQRSGERWRPRQAPPSPLPEDASELASPTPASSSREPNGSNSGRQTASEHPSSRGRELTMLEREFSQNLPQSGRAMAGAIPPTDATGPAASTPPANMRQPPPLGPPVLPQLWAVQPRIMTPHSPYEPSTKRSYSVTPSTVTSHVFDMSTRQPLRRVDSDPGSGIGIRVASDLGSSKGSYIDPSLRLRPSPCSSSMRSSKSGCRYTATLTLG